LQNCKNLKELTFSCEDVDEVLWNSIQESIAPEISKLALNMRLPNRMEFINGREVKNSMELIEEADRKNGEKFEVSIVLRA
jgi:hypothetical protein